LRYSATTAFLAFIYADTVEDVDSRYRDHRASHGSLKQTIEDPLTNRHILYGALVGGPTAADDSSYVDDRTNFQANEVALDYNAGFTGAVARMVLHIGPLQ
jgi:endoglucanase